MTVWKKESAMRSHRAPLKQRNTRPRRVPSPSEQLRPSDLNCIAKILDDWLALKGHEDQPPEMEQLMERTQGVLDRVDFILSTRI